MINIFADAPQAALTQLVQLVVLCIPLFILPMIIKNASSIMGKIGNAADKTMKNMGVEKGLGMAQGEARGYGKGKALNMAARAKVAGDENPRHRSNTARILRRAAGFRDRRKFERDNWAKERARKQQEGLVDFYGEKQKAGEDRRARAAGIGGEAGEARVKAAIAGQRSEMFSEAVKLEKAELSMSSTDELARALREAIESGHEERAYAAADLITSMGAPGAVAGGKVLSDMASGLDFNDNTAKLAAGIIRSNGKDFNAVDPALARWADQNPKPVDQNNQPIPTKTLDTVVGAAGTYTGASPEKMSTWDIGALQRAHQAAHAAGGTQWATMVQQANDMLGSRYAENLTPEVKIRYQSIANNQAPPPPPPPPSDRRLKRNITSLGTHKNIPLYRFQYHWNETEYVGTMAQDIIDSYPMAVSTGKDGYYRVDYSQLEIEMTTYKEWVSRNN